MSDAREAEIEALKAKHAALVDALRVVGELHIFINEVNLINAESIQTSVYNIEKISQAVEFINAAIMGE